MSTRDAIYSYVSLVVTAIESETYAWQQCETAALRHYILKYPNTASSTVSLPWTYIQKFYSDDRSGNMEAAENAVMMALGFYGFYRFGKKAEESLCSQSGNSIGYALGLCASKLDNKRTLDAWMQHFSEAHQPKKIFKSLRELIPYLRKSDEFIPVNFASLAVDLYDLQQPGLSTKAGDRIAAEYRHGCLHPVPVHP